MSVYKSSHFLRQCAFMCALGLIGGSSVQAAAARIAAAGGPVNLAYRYNELLHEKINEMHNIMDNDREAIHFGFKIITLKHKLDGKRHRRDVHIETNVELLRKIRPCISTGRGYRSDEEQLENWDLVANPETAFHYILENISEEDLEDEGVNLALLYLAREIISRRAFDEVMDGAVDMDIDDEE